MNVSFGKIKILHNKKTLTDKQQATADITIHLFSTKDGQNICTHKILHKKFNWILRIYLDWFNRKVSIDRVNEVLNLDAETQEGEEVTSIESVEFKNVDFAYDSENVVLNGFNLKINKGETS